MRKLTLSISSLLLLAVQLNAQQQPNAVSVNTNPNLSVSTNSSSRAYASNNVSINANVANTVSTNGQDQADDPMKVKTFTKSFTVNKSDKVNLANQFGGTTIKIWDKNEIKVDAEIKAYANTEAEAQKLLDDASINASKDGDQISFKTDINNRNGNWGSGSRNGKKWRREVRVNYTVYMPSSNALSASQQYGNLIMDDYNGPTSLKVQYGNLTTGDLNNANNYISVQYGKAGLKNVNQAKIKHQYGGGLTIASVGTIELDAQYTTVNIGNIKGNATIKHQYGGGITIGSAGTLNIDAQYTTIKLATLRGNATFKVQYGKLNVDQVETSCKDLNISTDYSNTNLGFDANFNADFNVAVSYADFKYGSNVTAKRQGDDDDRHASAKSYTGQIGKGGAGNVNIKADYGAIVFK